MLGRAVYPAEVHWASEMSPSLAGSDLVGSLFLPFKHCRDLIKVMLVMRGDFIEFIFQCPDSCFTVNEFEVPASAVMLTSQMNDSTAGRVVDLPGQIQWHLRIV